MWQNRFKALFWIAHIFVGSILAVSFWIAFIETAISTLISSGVIKEFNDVLISSSLLFYFGLIFVLWFLDKVTDKQIDKVLEYWG